MTREPHAALVVRDLGGLMRLLRESEPGRPRLTWYGADGERVELSGRVLDNWVAKTANLLVDELDVGPGSRVLLHLPLHWRTATWLLATWWVGATALVPDTSDEPLRPTDVERAAGGDVDVVVSDRPHLLGALVAAGVPLVAQPLPALSRGWDGELPPGALDATTVVRGQGDVFVPSTDPDDGALFAAAAQTLSATTWPPRPRVLISTAAQADLRPSEAPGQWLLAPLAADGSLVVVASAPGSAGYESAAAQEGVTARR